MDMTLLTAAMAASTMYNTAKRAYFMLYLLMDAIKTWIIASTPNEKFKMDCFVRSQ